MSFILRDLNVTLGSQPVVQSANLTLERGKLVGLIGANGAGKTTLLRAAAGLIPSTGHIEIDGTPNEEMTPRLRAHRLAYLPQGHRVDWALSVRDVIGLGRFPFQGILGQPRPEDETIIDEVMTRLDVQRFSSRPITDLSGGERAIVLLARALAAKAPYLFADEPTAALDPSRQLEVMDLLKAEAARGTGLLVVLHDLSLATRYLDEVVVMSDGQIIAKGLPGDVLTPDTLGQAFGITPLSGEIDGERWLIPWRRHVKEADKPDEAAI